MKTVLIAASNEVLLNSLTEALQKIYAVHTCSRGDKVAALLDTLETDALILDLALPYLDGLSVLQKASHKPRHILALTRVESNYVIQSCEKAGISYVMTLPCRAAAVAERLQDMMEFSESPEQITCRHLDKLGLNELRRGYQQLAVGVPMFRKDQQQTLQKELYPAIAKACGCETAEQVESAIRAVIRSAWETRDAGVWEGYFPKTDKAPSNRKFLNALSKRL